MTISNYPSDIGKSYYFYVDSGYDGQIPIPDGVYDLRISPDNYTFRFNGVRYSNTYPKVINKTGTLNFELVYNTLAADKDLFIQTSTVTPPGFPRNGSERSNISKIKKEGPFFFALGSVLSGSSSALAGSTDLITWTLRSPDIRTLNDIFYYNGIYYIAGADISGGQPLVRIKYSTDSITWTSASTSGFYGQVLSIAYDGNNRYVAGGTKKNSQYASDDYMIWHSTGGTSWSSLNMQNVFGVSNGTVTDVKYISGLYYAYANGSLFGGASSPSVSTSTDGVNWTTATVVPVNLVDHDGTKFVGASSSVAYTSTDGINWTTAGAIPSPFGGVVSLRHNNGRYVATSDRTIAVSHNLIDWQRKPYFGSTIISMNYSEWNGDNLYVAYNDFYSNTALIEVKNGRNDISLYTITTSGTASGASSYLNIIFGGGKFVATAAGHLSTSTDGLIWYRNSGVTPSLSGLTYGNGLYLVSVSGGTSVSTDMITWTNRSTVAATSISYGNNIYVLLNRPTGTTYTIQTSTNTITWTTRDANITGQPSKVSSINGLFFMTGTAPSLLTSADAITWTTRTTPLTNINGIAYLGGTYFAAGSESILITSSTGFSWTAYPQSVFSGEGITAMMESDGILYATSSSGSVFISMDGFSWDKASGFGTTINAIAYGAEKVIIVGSGPIADTLTLEGKQLPEDVFIIAKSLGTQITELT